MVDLKTEIEKLSREELVAIVKNVTMINTFQFHDLTGNVLGHISTTAPKNLLERVWNNLRELDRYTTLEALVLELNERDYYAEFSQVDTFLVMNL